MVVDANLVGLALHKRIFHTDQSVRMVGVQHDDNVRLAQQGRMFFAVKGFNQAAGVEKSVVGRSGGVVDNVSVFSPLLQKRCEGKFTADAVAIRANMRRKNEFPILVDDVAKGAEFSRHSFPDSLCKIPLTSRNDKRCDCPPATPSAGFLKDIS